ncbi:ABC transporter ATP-binding protein [Faecalicatena sp. Marseille-Q4148]|nr:ABC transporter ATP-binding protein [Faecalicatena sp. Marseille-Q4148]
MHIDIQHFTKRIDGTVVLDDISLQMESGKIYGFQGKNGSGKSMLMRAICGLIHPTEGSIKIDEKLMGTDISFPESAGILIENPGFISSYSGLQNLKLIASIKRQVKEEYIKELMERFHLDPADKKAYRKYSLGMKQKLGIIAAIMEMPELIILDEPMNGLDEESIEILKDMILELKEEGKLIILSCHDSEELLYLADEIFNLKNGKLI